MRHRHTAGTWVCGNCRFWDNTDCENYNEKHHEEYEALGTCTYAIHANGDNGSSSIKRLTACVIDGSGYFAALRTRHTHGCNAHETNN